MDIKTPTELKEAIEKGLTWDIARYKWYQWYEGLNIKVGSREDDENTEIFKDLEVNNPKLHKEVEEYIDKILIPKLTGK